MSLHDEIEAEMASYATATTGGLDLYTYTCLVLGDRAEGPERAEKRTARLARAEDNRRDKREKDPAFAESERARWKRANDARAERKRAAAYAAAQHALAERIRLEALTSITCKVRCPHASTAPHPTRPAT